MSAREWQPGDVAMVECSDGEWRRAGYRRCTPFHAEAWEFEDGALRRVNESRTRPLAVIDPEDREQVERLVRTLIDSTSDAGVRAYLRDIAFADVQAALREFANPPDPKPDEPTGLGAVVEDAEGKVFVRIPDGDDADVWFDNRGDFYSWTSIAAVRVLSEGVTE